jgi:cytochrome c oxidase subunit 2
MLAMRVVADNFRWHLRYSGPDGKLDTTDDVLMQRHLHLPANTEISIDLQSKDYVYSFYLPHIALMEVAIPNMPFNLKFETGSSGTFELLGSQMCGYTHPNLLADVVIHAPANFETWLSKVGNGQD